MPRSRRVRTSRRRKSRSYRRRMKRRRTRAPRRTGGWRNPLRHELKYKDHTGTLVDLGDGAASTTIAGAPQFVCLNGTQQGSAADQRIGRQIMVRKLIGRMQFTNAQNLATGIATWPVTYRFMVVYDMQANGSTLALADMFETPSNILSLQNLNNRDRFKIVTDKMWTIGNPYFGQSQISKPNQAKSYKFYKRLNLPVQYNAGNAGTEADIATGTLWAIMLTDSGNTAVGGGSRVNYRFRIRYSDM